MPAIDGFRDVLDLGLFLVVAMTVVLLVNNLRRAIQKAIHYRRTGDRSKRPRPM
jgi:hypothetical protein